MDEIKVDYEVPQEVSQVKDAADGLSPNGIQDDREAMAVVLAECRRIILAQPNFTSTGEIDTANVGDYLDELAYLCDAVRYRGAMPSPPDEWRFVDGAEDYIVTKGGEVYKRFFPDDEDNDAVWRKIKAQPSEAGYLRVSIDGEARQVSHLVLEAFVGPRPEEDYEACHFPDRSPSNNRLDNLRWGTREENTRDRRILRIRDLGLDKEEVVAEIYRLRYVAKLSKKQIGIVLGYNESTIDDVLKIIGAVARAEDPALAEQMENTRYDDDVEVKSAAALLGSRGGSVGGGDGGRRRAAVLSPERRSEIARMGAMARNKNRAKKQP